MSNIAKFADSVEDTIKESTLFRTYPRHDKSSRFSQCHCFIFETSEMNEISSSSFKESTH